MVNCFRYYETYVGMENARKIDEAIREDNARGDNRAAEEYMIGTHRSALGWSREGDRACTLSKEGKIQIKKKCGNLEAEREEMNGDHDELCSLLVLGIGTVAAR